MTTYFKKGDEIKEIFNDLEIKFSRETIIYLIN